MKIIIPVSKNVLAPLATIAAASDIDAAVKKRYVEQENSNNFSNINEDIGKIIKMIKSVEVLGLLIDGRERCCKSKKSVVRAEKVF